MMKVLYILAAMAAISPGIKAAIDATQRLAHMRATVAQLGDPLVLRDDARYAACLRDIRGQARSFQDAGAEMDGLGGLQHLDLADDGGSAKCFVSGEQ